MEGRRSRSEGVLASGGGEGGERQPLPFSISTEVGLEGGRHGGRSALAAQEIQVTPRPDVNASSQVT